MLESSILNYWMVKKRGVKKLALRFQRLSRLEKHPKMKRAEDRRMNKNIVWNVQNAAWAPFPLAKVDVEDCANEGFYYKHQKLKTLRPLLQSHREKSSPHLNLLEHL